MKDFNQRVENCKSYAISKGVPVGAFEELYGWASENCIDLVDGSDEFNDMMISTTYANIDTYLNGEWHIVDDYKGAEHFVK